MTTQAKVPAAPREASAYIPPTRKFTVAEYYRMAEVGILKPDERVELIQGRLSLCRPLARSTPEA